MYQDQQTLRGLRRHGGSEKKEGLEETEGTEDSYYIPNDYYLNEYGYDSDMFKKCWEDALERNSGLGMPKFEIGISGFC